MSLWNAVCSVHLCFSVRNRTHPLDEIRPMRLAGEFFSHRTHRFNRTFWRTVLNSQESGPSPNPSPAGRGVICEVTPTRLPLRDITKPTSFLYGYLGDYSPSLRGRGRGRGRYLSDPCVFYSSVLICEKKNILETRCGVFSLTELTDLTDPFGALFRTHRRPSAYRIHRAFQLKMAVRFCVIS